MAKFRKKPVVIEAFQWTGEPEAVNGLMQWALALPNKTSVESIVSTSGTTLTIRTLEGDHTASPGDWIICGVKGELYPCKPDIFAATYESAESALCGELVSDPYDYGRRHPCRLDSGHDGNHRP